MLHLPTIIIDLVDPFAPCFYGVPNWWRSSWAAVSAPLLMTADVHNGCQMLFYDVNDLTHPRLMG